MMLGIYASRRPPLAAARSFSTSLPVRCFR
jgi:hypothetical protein